MWDDREPRQVINESTVVIENRLNHTTLQSKHFSDEVMMAICKCLTFFQFVRFMRSLTQTEQLMVSFGPVGASQPKPKAALGRLTGH